MHCSQWSKRLRSIHLDMSKEAFQNYCFDICRWQDIITGNDDSFMKKRRKIIAGGSHYMVHYYRNAYLSMGQNLWNKHFT